MGRDRFLVETVIKNNLEVINNLQEVLLKKVINKYEFFELTQSLNRLDLNAGNVLQSKIFLSTL